jgi:hypothetical protein
MLINFNYVKFEFIVNWPGRPYFDLKLIKGQRFCINKHKVLHFTHHNFSYKRRGLKFVP